MPRSACDNCYKRKVQCILPEAGAGSVKCEWCEHRQIACTYDRVKGRRAKKQMLAAAKVTSPQSHTDDFAERIKRIEEFTAHIKSLSSQKDGTASDRDPPRIPTIKQVLAGDAKASNDYLPPLSMADRKPRDNSRSRVRNAMGQLYFAGLELGSVDSHTGMPILSDLGRELIFRATGSWPNFDFPCTPGDHKRPPMSMRRQTQARRSNPPLPDEAIIRVMLKGLFESKMNLRLPVIDAILFEDILETAYRPSVGELTYEMITSRACVFAFACFVGVRTGESRRIGIDIEECANEAGSLVMDLMEDPSLTMLQTILMLNLYNVVSGRFMTAYMLHATACRTLFVLGAHTLTIPPVPEDRPLTHTEREDRHLRWIFWICYILDKDLALRTGQPYIIGDEFCDLTLPAGYTQSGFSNDSPRGAPDETPLLPCDIRLSLIKAKACRLLYSADALRKSDAELLRAIRQLDEEVETWRTSLPPDIAPALSISSMSLLSHLKSGSGTPDTMHRIDLYLEYHHLMSVIHHASGRSRFLESKCPPDRATISILESSLELSVEASRSTVVYLSVAANEMAAEAAWIILFYPIAALMTLFFNILRDPLHQHATNDLDLIKLARDIIKNMPESAERPHAATSLKRLDLLIAELWRLGGYAIERAQNRIH
ncbi:hypothetical protein S40285_05378 [Stachybotrys chlorohalonatus IBT 40285]|uniref:Xylanolytic transcriptional activator regulatory domain-containing protein n=1 Tax=Stachybotrys chlorohalonatus (strain IBT 40285) TaxID=1283841 RepID=A0A084QPD9_STAC4|nr:hypothetical protein S40285_05378 [Stachybotrys chlorohalonata IBT 40285]